MLSRANNIIFGPATLLLALLIAVVFTNNTLAESVPKD